MKPQNESVTPSRRVRGVVTRRVLMRAGSGSIASLVVTGCISSAVQADARAGLAPASGDRPASPADGAAAPAVVGAREGIQGALDRRSAALAAGDREAFMATIDQRNLAWRRIQREEFDAWTAGGRRLRERYAVTRVEAKGEPYTGYFKAWIDVTAAGSAAVSEQAVWVYRAVDQDWLHTEVLNEEIGPRKEHVTEHFSLAHYAWDDDVIERIAAVAERAYAAMVARTALEPKERIQVSVNPTFGSHSSLRGRGTWAAYLPGAGQVLIRSLESYGAGTTTSGVSQDDRLLVAFTHELGHLAMNLVISSARLPGWMNEGYAEWVADNLRAGSFASALRRGRQITLDKASDIIETHGDPHRGYSGADSDIAYAHAAHAVAYFMERFGHDAFFAFATRFAETRKWDASFGDVTGSTWEDFQKNWLEWSRQKYGI